MIISMWRLNVQKWQATREDKRHTRFEISVSQAKLREFEKTVKRLDEELESSKAREDSLQDSVAG